MLFMAEILATKSAWQRAAKVVLASRAWTSLLALTVVLAVGHPATELPSFLTRWADVPEMESYLDQASKLTFISVSPTLRFVLIGIAVLLGFAVFLFLMFFIFRVPFMRFDLISGRRTELRDSWRETGDRALQWFLFGLCAGIAGATLSWLLDSMIGSRFISHFSWTSTVIRTRDILWPIVTMYCYWLADDFLIPVLSLDGGEVLHGVEVAWTMLRDDLAGLFRYLATKTFLVGLSALLLILICSLYVHAVFAPVTRMALHVLQANAPQGVLHVTIGATLAAVSVLLAMLVLACFWLITDGLLSAFFGAYALDFYASRYPVLRELLQPESTVSA